jgi:protein translocase SEC61 complex gamma subunit
MMENNENPGIGTKMKYKINEYWRVLRITKKPDGYEYKTILKISGLGMAIVGALGFIIQMAVEIMKRKGA